jgi:hypothetical protein
MEQSDLRRTRAVHLFSRTDSWEDYPKFRRERNHQEIDNQLIEPASRAESTSRTITCAQRLGGMLRFYRRTAA